MLFKITKVDESPVLKKDEDIVHYHSWSTTDKEQAMRQHLALIEAGFKAQIETSEITVDEYKELKGGGYAPIEVKKTNYRIRISLTRSDMMIATARYLDHVGYEAREELEKTRLEAEAETKRKKNEDPKGSKG